MAHAFDAQVARLANSGFLGDVICSLSEKLISKIEKFYHCDSSALEISKKKRQAVIPYIHRIAHGLKNVGARYCINMSFSARNKVHNVCTLVDRALCQQPGKGNKCVSSHVHRYAPCTTGVVYGIPLSCSCEYLGEMGHYINVCLREHGLMLSDAKITSNLAARCRPCGCVLRAGQRCPKKYSGMQISKCVVWKHKIQILR